MVKYHRFISHHVIIFSVYISVMKSKKIFKSDIFVAFFFFKSQTRYDTDTSSKIWDIFIGISLKISTTRPQEGSLYLPELPLPSYLYCTPGRALNLASRAEICPDKWVTSSCHLKSNFLTLPTKSAYISRRNKSNLLCRLAYSWVFFTIQNEKWKTFIQWNFSLWVKQQL